MINVLYIYSSLKPGGPTNQLYYLIKNIDRSRFKPMILTLLGEMDGSHLSRFLDLGIEVRCLNQNRKRLIIRSTRKTHAILNDFSPDIVQSYGTRADMFSVTDRNFGNNTIKITTVRNDEFHDAPLIYGNPLGSFFANLYEKNIKRMDCVVSCSEHIRDTLEKRGVRSQVIRNGIDMEFFSPPLYESRKGDIRRKLSLMDSESIILSVGSLEVRKDPFLIIDSFKRSKLLRRYSLVILGNGPLLKKCIKRAGSRKVIFQGRVSNVADYLSISDLFVSASKGEGFPNSVLEALSMGVPALLSDIAPHEEIRNLFQKHVKLFRAGSSDSLVELLDKLQDNPLTINEEDLIVIRENLNAKKMSEAYQRLYVKLLGMT